MKLVILDPDLASFTGHNFNYLQGLVRTARSRGIETRIYGHRRIEPDVAKALGAAGHFTTLGRAVLTDVSIDLRIRTAWTHAVLNAVFARDLAALNQELGPQTLVFAPAATSRQLLALAQWLALIAPASLPKMVCLFRYDLDAYPEERELLRLPLVVLSSLSRPAMLCCETEENAKAHAAAFGLVFDVLPSPFDLTTPDRVGAAGRRSAPVIGYFGDARYMKGFHLLPGLAEAAAAADGEFRLRIQAFSAGDDAAAPGQLRQVRRVAASAPTAVRLFERTMNAEQYHRLVLGCDVVLLPYLASAYRLATSAVFCEAIAAGKVVVVPEDTWMSRVLRRFGAEPATFDAWSVQSVLAALRAVLGELPARTIEAVRLAKAWKSANGPERVLDCLERWHHAP